MSNGLVFLVDVDPRSRRRRMRRSGNQFDAPPGRYHRIDSLRDRNLWREYPNGLHAVLDVQQSNTVGRVLRRRILSRFPASRRRR